jgi:hypothetical protein
MTPDAQSPVVKNAVFRWFRSWKISRMPSWRILIFFLALIVSGNKAYDDACLEDGSCFIEQTDPLPDCTVFYGNDAHIQTVWHHAIASYDPIRQAMWLEFNVHDLSPSEQCRCGATRDGTVSDSFATDFHTHSWTAVVEMDGEIAAISHDSEVGIEIAGLRLGRHWASIHVEACNRQIIMRGDQAEFFLPFHAQVMITHPPHRSSVQLMALSHSNGGTGVQSQSSPVPKATGQYAQEELIAGNVMPVCFHTVLGANCTEDCVTEASGVLSIDGEWVMHFPSLLIGEAAVKCFNISAHAADNALQKIGRHLIAVELLHLGTARLLGPMSPQHHVIVDASGAHTDDNLRALQTRKSAGRQWIEGKFAGSTVTPLHDDLIKVGSQGISKPWMNPSVYYFRNHDQDNLRHHGGTKIRDADASLSGWRVVFREHSLKVQFPEGYFLKLEPSVQVCFFYSIETERE